MVVGPNSVGSQMRRWSRISTAPGGSRRRWSSWSSKSASSPMADAMGRVRATEARMFDHSEISLLFQEPATHKLPSISDKEHRSRLLSQRLEQPLSQSRLI